MALSKVVKARIRQRALLREIRWLSKRVKRGYPIPDAVEQFTQRVQRFHKRGEPTLLEQLNPFLPERRWKIADVMGRTHRQQLYAIPVTRLTFPTGSLTESQ